MAPPKIAGYTRAVATAGIQGWEPSWDGAQTATAASVRTVTAVMLTAAISPFPRLRRSFAAHGSQTRWPCMSDGPAKARGAYSDPPQFPHRPSRFRRADLAARNIANEVMLTGSAAMVARLMASSPNMIPPLARGRLA